MTDDEILKLSWEDDMRDYNGYIRTVPFARAVLAAGASEGQAIDWYDRLQRVCADDYGDYPESESLSERLRWWVPKSSRHGSTTLEDDMLEASAELTALRENAIYWEKMHDEKAREYFEAMREITALRERVSGVEKDAERYRWLRGHLGKRVLVDLFGSPSGPGYTMDGIDAEIDLELKQEPKQ